MGVIYYKDKMYAGGGGCNSYGGTDTPTSTIGTDGDYYYQYDQTGDIQISYVKLSGVWHKIAGGDIIGGGEPYYENNAVYIMDGNIGMEGTVNAD